MSFAAWRKSGSGFFLGPRACAHCLSRNELARCGRRLDLGVVLGIAMGF